MRPSEFTLGHYGGFCAWLRTDFRRAFDDTALLEVFARYAGVTPARAIGYISGGLDAPALHATNLGAAWGQFRDAEPNWVFVHWNLAAAVQELTTDGRVTLFAKAKLLHELVHLGLHEARKPEVGEQGAAFEGEAFAPDTGEALLSFDYLPDAYIPPEIRGLANRRPHG